MTAPQPTAPTPTLFPTPPNFVITWTDAADQALTWQQDRQHVPEPITPMSDWFARDGFGGGFRGAVASFNAPVTVRVNRFNTYYYMAIVPTVPPEQFNEAAEKAGPAVQAAMAIFADRWRNEWLPELQGRWDVIASPDLRTLSDQGLAGHLDVLFETFTRAWHIHFELLLPAMVGFDQFVRLYEQLFPGEPELQPYKLLQGFDNASLRAGRALWALSRAALAEPAVLRMVETTPSSELYQALGATDATRAFRARVDGFLADFGRRSDTVQEAAHPSWINDPTPLFDNLKAYVKQTDDPDETHRRLREERERLVAEARAKLEHAPAEARGAFEFLLKAAQDCSWVQEDHNHWIDQRSVHEVYQICMEFGRRLTERGVLAEAADIFMLDGPEAKAALLGAPASLKQLTASRRAEMDHFARIAPAPMAGTDYGPPPSNPLTDAITRFFGAPPPAATDAKVVPGIAGSAGVVRGIARRIITIDEAARLEPGDILVTATTSPPWTPLFATAAAIVTDTGGPLSHCAIVAREYGIPAVVGTMTATHLIADGATIEVDGDKGEVRILS